MISPAPPLFKPTSRKMCPAGPVYAGFVKPKPPNLDYLRVRRRLVATTRGAMLVGFAVGTTRTMVGFLAAVATLAAIFAVTALVAGRRGGTFRSIGLLQAVERDFARLRIDLDNLDLHHVAHGEHVLDLADATIGHAGDVQQAVRKA